MTLELFDHLKFLHPVGISTCKYGVTIPLEAQTMRMLAIAKGQKVPVTILLGGDEPVLAEIRRLNNQPGHLQFRYEKKAQELLRQALARIFDGGVAGNLLEVEEIAPLIFRFKPILKTTSPRLQRTPRSNRIPGGATPRLRAPDPGRAQRAAIPGRSWWRSSRWRQRAPARGSRRTAPSTPVSRVRSSTSRSR